MESMNNKDPFETFLKSKSFSEKASESLLVRLKKNASWNRPWWKSLTSLAMLAVVLVVVVSVLLVVIQQPPPEQAPALAEEQLFPLEPETPPQVIAQNGDKNMLSPFSRQLADAAPEFNLSFIDRPVNFIQARREYADLI